MRKLEVWKDAVFCCELIYKSVNLFLKEELFGLTSRMKRASISIPSNIAERARWKTTKEFSRFLETAIGSAFELETQLIIARNNQYVSKGHFEEFINQLHSLQNE